MNRYYAGAKIWLLVLLFSTAAASVCFRHYDVRIAQLVFPLLGHKEGLAAGLGAAVLLTGEAAVFVFLGAARIVRGHISPFSKAVALGCVSSLCAYAVNSSVLKVLFGVPNPAEVLGGAHHAFHFLQGSPSSSFPSGHMVLAGAFAGVLMRLYRASIWPLSALLFIAAVLLIVGDWHFVSDVIAGSFVGVSAGLLAGELWLTHIVQNAPGLTDRWQR